MGRGEGVRGEGEGGAEWAEEGGEKVEGGGKSGRDGGGERCRAGRVRSKRDGGLGEWASETRGDQVAGG